MNVALDVLLLIDLGSCRVLIFMAARWTLHFWLFGATGAAQPQSRRQITPEKLSCLYLFSVMKMARSHCVTDNILHYYWNVRATIQFTAD